MRWSDCVNRLCIISHAGREAGNGYRLPDGVIHKRPDGESLRCGSGGERPPGLLRTSTGDYRLVEGILRDLRGGRVDFAKQVAPDDGDAKQAQDEVGFVNGKADQTIDGKYTSPSQPDDGGGLVRS
jgi:hypothetical protein